MANALVHEVQVIDGITVETTNQLIEAIRQHTGDDLNLSHSYRIELIQERLSDGSLAFEIGIRKAEPV